MRSITGFLGISIFIAASVMLTGCVFIEPVVDKLAQRELNGPPAVAAKEFKFADGMSQNDLRKIASNAFMCGYTGDLSSGSRNEMGTAFSDLMVEELHSKGHEAVSETEIRKFLADHPAEPASAQKDGDRIMHAARALNADAVSFCELKGVGTEMSQVSLLLYRASDGKKKAASVARG